MRAAFYERTGPAEEVLQVGELPTPTPGSGEVRVKLSWSGINPSDVKTRGGVRSKTLPFARIVPHSDGAGIIDAVGTGVPAGRIGESVWTWNAAWGRPFGTAAEYVALPQAQAVRLPRGTEAAAGACLGIPALTALHAIKADGGVSGKSVLIAGGAGAVGHYAVQLAKLFGAGQVIATVSGAEKAALATQAGADLVLNYKTEDVHARVQEATGGRGVDRIVEVDLGTNIELDLQLITPDGELVVYGSNAPQIPMPFLPLILKNVGLRFFIVYNLDPTSRQEEIALLSELLQQGRLQHNIAARLPLEQIAAAHVLVEQGRSLGNVVLSLT